MINLNGVIPLSRDQQSIIQGGYESQSCTFTLTHSDNTSVVKEVFGYSDGQGGSDEANHDCVNFWMAPGSGVTRCQYNCSWDD